MILLRKSRLMFWLARELLRKYTFALVLGFTIGVGCMYGIWRLIPTIRALWFTPSITIGIVGEFTPSSLPYFIQKEISMGLTNRGIDGTALPGLADTWTATDSGKTYIFHLRRDLLWHDGKPVGAYDVNYNIRDVLFTPVDDGTLRASLKDIYSPFPVLVSKPILLSGLMGFGDYKVNTLRLKGQRVEFLKLIPYIDRSLPVKIYRFYTTETKALLAYKLGDIDRIESISSIQDIGSQTGTNTVEKTNYDRIVSLFFNTKDTRLSERSFRQALGYGVPQVPFEKAYSPIHKNSWAYTDKVRHYDPSVDQAKTLLEKSASASQSGQLVLTTFSQYVDIAETIASAWTALGVETKVRVENSVPADYQVLLSAQNIPPDCDQYPFWHSTQQETNITGYTNIKIDKILEDIREEFNQERRKKLCADFQRFIVEDAPVLFLYYPKLYTIERK